MKLGSLKSNQSLDGELILVHRDLKKFVRVSHVAACLREALEKWNQVEPILKKISDDLNSGALKNIETVRDEKIFHSCLPRTWLFADGSAYIHHIKLVRQARKAPLPATLLTSPLMYQAESGRFLAPTEDIPQVDFNYGTDFEAEVGVIVDHVPMGISAEKALSHIKLIVLINDVSLRGLIPEELEKGFGFFQSKPPSSLSPVAVTPDELGEAWDGRRVHLNCSAWVNGELLGQPNGGKDMQFDFPRLIAHAAKTRPLSAGTIIGSGTVSNRDRSTGAGCLFERRAEEIIAGGEAKTAYLKFGGRVKIEMLDSDGRSVFGAIDQTIAQHPHHHKP